MLTDCPECSRQISSKAASCPHCGVRFIVKKNGASFRWLTIFLLGGIFFALAIIIGFIILVFESASEVYK